MELLEARAEEALFEGRIDALVAVVQQNERPLSGLAAWLDWRFGGAVSRMIRQGFVSGAAGECVYLPLTRPLAQPARVYRVLLLGAGYSEAPGRRARPAPSSLAALRRNLGSLKLSSFGLSRADFGMPDDAFLNEHFADLPLRVTS